MEKQKIKSSQSVFLMQNKIMNYSWGTTDFIADLLGISNHDQFPQAELWMGAHKKAPSSIIINDQIIPLDQYIREHSDKVLGDHTDYSELPFLFKVLSAAKPLSIQVHPTKEQAEIGYRIEEEKLLPLEAKIRNYKDTNHKPEMLLALTRFQAMAGIRPYFEIGDIVTLLRLNDKIEEFQSLIVDLSENKIRKFMLWLLKLKGRTKEKVRNNILKAAFLRRDCDHPAALAIEWICRLDEYYPDDIGIFAPILMNTFELQPGEAIYMDAGILHAYLQGSGLEVMANSDNVLRCALTSKHIDISELMKIARFEPDPPHYIRPQMENNQEVYHTPSKEFKLSHLKLDGSYRINEINSPTIMLVTDGKLKIEPEYGNPLKIKKGQSAMITADSGFINLKGMAKIYKITI